LVFKLRLHLQYTFFIFIFLLCIIYIYFIYTLIIFEFPIFFISGFILYSSVFTSLLFFQYLSLYGIFIINYLSILFFWITLCTYIPTIFYKNFFFVIYLYKWVIFNSNYIVDFYFIVDTISFSFVLLTTSIAVFVFLYAFSYFRYEPLVDRFILFLLLFIISMIFLVSSGNLIMLFLGWELIGLTSFLLINFWVTKIGTLKASFKAFTFNKISDFWLFIFLLLIVGFLYDIDIFIINNSSHLYCNSFIRVFNFLISFNEFVCLFLLFSAFIKSAQFGAHIWLPDSMEAPVPASSLIHSATLVSAGIFLVLRFNNIFDNSLLAKYLLAIIGSLTAAYGGVSAANQPDIKRILAYSTISHCGFLMVLCFTQINEFTILYLYVHGFFKACTFMCVGNVIRISKNYQDFRRMGFFWKYIPFEAFATLIGLINLCGLPFTVGFLIKHILLIGLYPYILMYYVVLFFCIIGAVFGLFYSYRVYFNVFFDFKKGKKILYKHLNRNILNSNRYSNTSLASNFSIFFLFLVSYIISYILYLYFLNINILFSDCFNSGVYSNFYSILSMQSGNLLNFSLLNVIILSFIFILSFSNFRETNNIYYIFYFVFTLIFLIV